VRGRVSTEESRREETEGRMIQDEITNSKIVDRVCEVLKELGRAIGGHSVRTVTFERGDPNGGQFDLSDQAGIWEIRLSDGSTYSLPLTFEEAYDAGSDQSPKLRAAIKQALG